MIEADQSGSIQDITRAAFVLHVGGGTLGLLSGIVAIFARKGGPLHRFAGNIFFVSMSVMAIFAIYLAIVMPDQLVNVFIGTFALYLVATAWLTVTRKEGAIGFAEKFALGVALVLSAPFLLLSFQLATGMEPFLKSAVPLKGAVLIAVYSFTGILSIAALGDLVTVLSGGISGRARIARHLWRMCLGLTLATGSAFTNGLPRLLPGPFHVPQWFLYPQLVWLFVLVFWMIRVRLTNWYEQPAN